MHRSWQWRIQHWGHWGRAPNQVPKYSLNLTNFWRGKWLARKIVSVNRNWLSLIAMKLLTAKKHNIVQWPKLHNLQNGIFVLFPGNTPLYLVLGASRLIFRSSSTDIYVTIGLGISVSEHEIFVTIVPVMCFWKQQLAHPTEWSRGAGLIHPTDFKKFKAIFKWKFTL